MSKFIIEDKNWELVMTHKKKTNVTQIKKSWFPQTKKGVQVRLKKTVTAFFYVRAIVEICLLGQTVNQLFYLKF